MKRKKPSQTRRCRKCGKRQKGRGGKRKADELEERLEGMQVKKARGEMTEEEYSKDRKTLLAEYSGQTGEPMQLDGEEMKQRYGPKITARRRKPTPAENDLQLFEMQRAILGPTYTNEEFMERKNASANWSTQPADGEVPAYTDWRTVPGYPKLPTNASGQVTKDQNQVASDYSLMRAPGALKSVISKVISALGVTRSVGYKAATYALKNPTLILQFGAIGLTMYQTWNYWGPIVENVLKALGWVMESGARANAQGAAYMRNAVPDMPQVTSPSEVVYTELPSATQVVQSVGRDIGDLFQQTLGDPALKATVQTVLETTVQEVNQQRSGLVNSISDDLHYMVEGAPEVFHQLLSWGKAAYKGGQLGTGRVFSHDLVHTGF
jgi:hypothetical protein